MANYEITAPDGSKWRITAPEGASETEVLDYARNQWSAQQKPKAEGPGYLQGVTREAAQGVTLGAADEVEAGGMTAVDMLMGLPAEAKSWATGEDNDYWAGVGEAWDKNRAHLRGQREQFQKENPVSSATANVIGGFATAAPVVGRAVGAGSGIAKWGRAGAAGAGLGGVAGFNATDGGVGERATGALEGAAIGAGTALATPAVAGMVSKALTPAWRAIMDRASRNAPRVEERKVIEALMDDFGVDTADEAVQRATARLRTLGPNATIADLGENSRSLLGAVVNRPGPTRAAAANMLERRQRGQGGRIKASADRALGADNSFYQSLDDLSQQRQQAAAPLYERAYAKDFVWSDTLESLMGRPSMKKAAARAYRIASEEGRDPRALGMDFNDAGDVVFTRRPSMQTLDYVKRGLDDVVEQFRDKTTGRLVLDESGRAINNTRALFRSELDSLNPDYRAAREAWAGPTDMMEAMARGRQFSKPDAEITERLVRDMTDSERQSFVLGVRRAIEDQLDRTPDTADAVRRLLGTEQRRKALRAAFPSERAYRSFVADLMREGQMNRTRVAVNTGSPTQPRQQAEARLQTDPGAVASLATGDAFGGVRGVVQMLPGFLRGEVPDAARAGIGQMLMQNDTQRLAQRAMADGLSEEARQALARALAGDLAIYGGQGAGG